jgi:hypothetical protein
VVTENTDRYYGCYSNGDVTYMVMENITRKQIEVQKKFRTSHGFTQFISICYNERNRGSFGWACTKDWGNINCIRNFGRKMSCKTKESTRRRWKTMHLHLRSVVYKPDVKESFISFSVNTMMSVTEQKWKMQKKKSEDNLERLEHPMYKSLKKTVHSRS